jgi:hypothetical protein
MPIRRTVLGLAAAALVGLPASASAAAAPPAAAGPIVRGEFVSKTESGTTPQLAFTGYEDWLVATVGAGLLGTGILLRRRAG